ncbi:hypothetical protein [Vibrio sp. ER1A]|uniref:hypothetical protein n=1 Tax=Vibrio sp. ER1A TaxID=1517681 RepID=UPI0004DD0BB3|nr:hypothetical protein [Vibrio sp. ER1A]KFA98040.1 hypothetical protein HW45_11805 [Vibrio sp. ER1A]
MLTFLALCPVSIYLPRYETKALELIGIPVESGIATIIINLIVLIVALGILLPIIKFVVFNERFENASNYFVYQLSEVFIVFVLVYPLIIVIPEVLSLFGISTENYQGIILTDAIVIILSTFVLMPVLFRAIEEVS